MESTTGYTFNYPLFGIFNFPWHRHQIEGTNGFYCLIRKTERFTISNVESQVFTPNNSRLDPGSNPGCPRDKRMSYHWTNCASHGLTAPLAGYTPIRPIGVNRPAFGGTVPHFHLMSRGPAKSADVPHFSKMVLFFFSVTD